MISQKSHDLRRQRIKLQARDSRGGRRAQRTAQQPRDESQRRNGAFYEAGKIKKGDYQIIPEKSRTI